MSFNIDQIKIKLDTNIPGIFYFTKDTLYYPDLKKEDYSEYPFFTQDILYPSTFLNGLDYQRKTDFFFNQNEFQTILLSQIGEENINKNKKTDTEKKEIGKKNILTMLNALFPSHYPVINNVSESYGEFILDQTPPTTFKGAIPRIMQKFFPETKTYYSYIQNNGKQYTVIGTIWLNDVLNHPEYRELIDNTRIYISSYSKKYSDVLKVELEKSINGITTLLHDGYDDFDTYFEKFNEQWNKEIREKNTRMSSERKTDITDFIDYMKKIKSYKGKKDINIENAVDDVINFEASKEKAEKYITIPNKVNTYFKKIIKEVNKYNANKIIQDKYITDKMSIAYDKEDSKYKDIITDELKKNYRQFINFADSFKKYTSPYRETGNENLKIMINEYSNGKNTNFLNFVKSIEKHYYNYKNVDTGGFKHEDMIKAMDIGYVVNTETKDNETAKNGLFETSTIDIYVLMNLVEGIIDDSSIGDVNCSFKDEFLGNMFEKLIYKKNYWEVNKKRALIKLKDLKQKKKLFNINKKGGKKTRRCMHNMKKNTRRARFI